MGGLNYYVGVNTVFCLLYGMEKVSKTIFHHQITEREGWKERIFIQYPLTSAVRDVFR